MQWPSSFTSLVDLASASQVRRLLSNEVSAFKTFVAWVYRIGPGDDNYWCKGVSAADLADETAQFSDLTAYIMQTYANSGSTFIFEHWEGDWSARWATLSVIAIFFHAPIASSGAWKCILLLSTLLQVWIIQSEHPPYTCGCISYDSVARCTAVRR